MESILIKLYICFNIKNGKFDKKNAKTNDKKSCRLWFQHFLHWSKNNS